MIHVLTDVGELSLWEFSGYEPYYMLYDHFLGDVNCIHVIVYNLTEKYEDQLEDVMFWCGFLMARTAPEIPIGKCVDLNFDFIPQILCSHL